MKFWLVRVMLLATAVAMIATSPPPTYSDSYTTRAAAPPALLSAETPRASFRVTVLAEALFQATRGAHAVVVGEIEHIAGSSFVRVTIDDASSSGFGDMNFLTSFSSGVGLEFTGNCQALDPSAPCQASFVVAFDRVSGAPVDAVSEVHWNIDVRAQIGKEKGEDAGPFPLPWTVEVTPLD